MKPRTIALINVPYGVPGVAMRPIGLAYLGAWLKANNVCVDGFDFSVSTASSAELIRQYNLNRYPIIGISFYNTNALIAYDLAKEIKRANPTCVIIAGGPHASASSVSILKKQVAIDIVVRNEGEQALLQLVQDGNPLRNVEHTLGCTYRKGTEIKVNEDQPRLSDLDSLPTPSFEFSGPGSGAPLAFFDQDEGRLRRAVAMVTSRSCPFRCSFCSIISIGRAWRSASPQKVGEDFITLSRLEDEPVEHIYFLDANFFVSVKRTLEVAKELQRIAPGVTFSFSTRANQVVKAGSHFADLRKYGLRAVEVGIESASQNVLDRLAKDTTVSQNYDTIRLLEEHNIKTFLDFIMFDAFSSLSDLEHNLRFLGEVGFDTYLPWDHLFNSLTPYLGTAIRNEYEHKIHYAWAEDSLPEPAELIQDERVQQVFVEFLKIKPMLSHLKDALEAIESDLSRDWNRESARRLMNAVSLRRMPYSLLENLVSSAQEGLPISFDLSLPKLFDEAGKSRSVRDINSHALL